MAVGVTSDATTIYIYDDTNAAAGGDGSYSFADIFAVLGGTGVDILRVDSGTGFPTYRFLKNLQIGDAVAGGILTTSLIDTNVVCTFDDQRVLKTRASQTTSWNCTLGIKVGSGNTASGKKGCHLYFTNTAGANSVIMRGLYKFYGCTFQSAWSAGTTQAFQLVAPVSGSEVVNCNIGGFSSIVLGQSGQNISNLYNVDITGDATTNNITSLFADSANRLTMAGNPGVSHLKTITAGITLGNFVFLGAPTDGDIAWNGPAATNWVLIRPHWSLSGKKISGVGPTTAANGAHEFWLYNPKVVDYAGTGVSGVTVKLTDSTGVVQVNAVTDVNGELSFGSGLTANHAIVADWYFDGVSQVLLNQRSPFLCELTYGGAVVQRYYFKWPGSEGVTNLAGAYEDVGDAIPLQFAGAGPTTWIELVQP